jgi:hypothetical protein
VYSRPNSTKRATQNNDPPPISCTPDPEKAKVFVNVVFFLFGPGTSQLQCHCAKETHAAQHTPRNTHYATPPTRPYHGSHLPSPTMSLNAISHQNPNPSIQSRPYYRSPTHPCLHTLHNQGYALFERSTSSYTNAQRSNIRLLENFRMPCPWLFAALLFRGVFCDARV